MTCNFTQDELRQMARPWMPSIKESHRFCVHTDTSDFFKIDYGDILVLEDRPYLIRQYAKEGRFGLDEEPKYWVRRAVDLKEGQAKYIKLTFHEKFTAKIGGIQFECFRSPRKEARILKLVRGHPHFMQGFSVADEKDNIVRIIDVVHGKSLIQAVEKTENDHYSYFSNDFPDLLRRFYESVSAIAFLHDHGEKHGDIRRDHIIIDNETGKFRWIDFDFNYRHRENIFGYDLFGLGNILIYLTGRGDILTFDLKKRQPTVLKTLSRNDVNIVFHNRVANLKKIYPYIPTALNRILMHFSGGAQRFYEHCADLLEDLSEVIDATTHRKTDGTTRIGKKDVYREAD